MTVVSFPVPYRSRSGYRIGGAVFELPDIDGGSAPIAITLPSKHSSPIEYRLHDGELWEPVLETRRMSLAAGTTGGLHPLFHPDPAVGKALGQEFLNLPLLSDSGLTLNGRTMSGKTADAVDMSEEFLGSAEFGRLDEIAPQFSMIDGHLHRVGPGPLLQARTTDAEPVRSGWLPFVHGIEHPWRRHNVFSVSEIDTALLLTGEPEVEQMPEIRISDYPKRTLLHCAIEGTALQILGGCGSMHLLRAGRSFTSAVLDLRQLLERRAPSGRLNTADGPYYVFERPYQPWKTGDALELIEPLAKVMIHSPEMRSRYGKLFRFIERRLAVTPVMALDEDEMAQVLSDPH